MPRGDEVFRVDKPVLSADRARYVGSDPAGEFPVPTKDQVMAAWGKPDSIEPPQEKTTEKGNRPGTDGVRLRGLLLWGNAYSQTPSRNERWIYEDGRRWKGMWLWILIVPIPLMYPGTNQMVVEYSGDSVVAVETVNTDHGKTTFCFPTLYYLIPYCGTAGEHESFKARFVSTRGLLTPDPRLGVASTFAGTAGVVGSSDGAGIAASFNYPVGIAVDGAGNAYVGDTNNGTIRKITAAGEVTTLAGTAGNVGAKDGTGAAASFSGPRGVAVDRAGNVYVADTLNHTIRKIAPGGVVSTLAGSAGNDGSADGKGTAARFIFPAGVATDTAGDIYVADTGNDTIRKITRGGVVSTLAGAAGKAGNEDGTGAEARFNAPGGVATDGTGAIYVADVGNNTIRKIAPGGVVTTLAAGVAFNRPSSVAVDSSGGVYVCDNYNNAVRRIGSGGQVTTVAGPLVAGLKSPGGVAADSAGNLYVADTDNSIIRRITASPPARP